MSSKAQVLSNNTNSFPNNNSGQITPQVLRDFNADFINSAQFADTPISQSISASYANNATSASIATSSSYANNATSASYALTASFALNAPTVDTGSFVTTSSFNAFSSSISDRVEDLEAFSSSLDATFATDAQLTALSASIALTDTTQSLQIAALQSFSSSLDTTFATDAQLNAATASLSASIGALSSSFLSTSSSLSTQVNALTAATSSYVTSAVTASSIVTASANVNIITFTKGDGSSFNVSVAVSGSVATASFAATAESASFAQTAISASYALNATSASNANLLDGLDSTAFVLNSQTSSMSVASASVATSASFASTIASGLNITASNILVTNNLVVNGTASFGYTKTTTGSAVIIGDEFIILNADTPAAPYAGIKVYDTGSATTASLEWNGNGDYWIQVDEAGESAAFLTGASGSKGSEVFPTVNRLTKGTGNNTIVNSNISDDGSTVSINSNTEVTGSLNVTAGITGSLFGTASFALNGGVTQILAGPNVTISPLSGRGQVTISSTGAGTGSFNTATGSYGSFYDTTTQTNPVANVARSMSFNETSITNGVSISGSTNPFNTYIKTENAGVYNIQFSAQIDKTDIGTDELYIWLSKNGNDLLDSAGKVTLDGGGDAAVVAWNWFVQSAANDYYQIKWSSPDTGMRILAEVSSSTHPGIPSIIATVDRIDQFLSNTGSFSGSFNGVFTGSLQGTASYATNATSASFADNSTSASYATDATSASFAQTAISASYAPAANPFPFTGSAAISGSLTLVGDQFMTGSLRMKPTVVTSEQPFTVTEGTDTNGFEGNIIITRNASTTQSGSANISGSNNIFIPSIGTSNTAVAGGAGFGFQGRSNIVTTANIQVTGSLGTGFDRQYPTFTNSVVNSGITITDNRPSGSTGSSLSLSGNAINGVSTTLTISTGSVTLGGNSMLGTTAIVVTGSNGVAKVLSSNFLGTATVNIDSTSGTQLTNSVINGSSVSLLLSGSTNTTVQNVLVVGNTLSVTGSASNTANYGSAYVGRFNDTGSTALVANTAFAVGTGTSASARKTSLHVSSSGLLTLTDGLVITGSVLTTSTINNMTVSTIKAASTTPFTTVVGRNAMASASAAGGGSQDGNTAIGHSALIANVNGIENTVLGDRAGQSVVGTADGTQGSYNVLIGDRTSVSTGVSNTLVGSAVFGGVGNNNTVIGSNVNIGTSDSNIVLADGAGNIRARYSGSWTMSGTVNTTASFAVSASFASTATSASFASTSTSASFASTSTSASYALTASYAENAGAGGVAAGDIYSYTFLTMGA